MAKNLIINPKQVVYNDLIQPLIAANLNTAAGKLVYNFPKKGVDIKDSTDITNDDHKIHFAYQITHDIKLNGIAHPHVHWFQNSAAVPNLWYRWRYWRNGQPVGAWTSEKLADNIFTYTSGEIIQISRAMIDIDFSLASGGQLNVSDFLDIEFTRDISNASGLFAGTDPVVGDVTIRAFDPHVQVDSNGSINEYNKKY